jgi:hypothetical protein
VPASVLCGFAFDGQKNTCKIQGVFILATGIETLLLDIIETDNGGKVVSKYKDLATKTNENIK